jgi:thioredoxin-related protein
MIMNEMVTRAWRGGLMTLLILVLSTATASAQAAAQKPAERAKPTQRPSIYDKSADALAQVDKAAAAARREDKRILLMFGGDWCSWCHKLHDLFTSDQEIQKILADDYELVMVDTAAPNAGTLETKCKQTLSKEDQQKGVGYPVLAVLDSDAKVVTAQPTGVLEDGDHHDPKRVKEFLSRWTAPRKDAKAVLEEALSRASADDKRVFLTFGAVWCGWCHRLSEWLARPEVAAILDRDLLVVKIDIDRMTAGKEVMKQYRGQDSGGIPWSVVLDSKGKALATAQLPAGILGYPLDPKDFDELLGVLKAHCRHIDGSQLGRLRHSLEDAAAQIKKELGRRS